MGKAGSVVLGLVCAIGAGGYYAYDELGWFKAKPAPPAPRASEAPAPPESPEEVARKHEHVVPELIDLDVETARKVVAKAGFRKDALQVRENTVCQYASDKEMKAVDTICQQAPQPGIKVSGLTDIRVVVEHDTYDHGSVGYSGEWRRMPDVTGATLEAAREILRDKGFADDEFEIDSRADCKHGTVCSTRPDPGKRKVIARKGTLWVP
jgi:beta-lactam-binding protein with PASTA domain